MSQASASLWTLLIVGWFAASVVYRLVSRKGLFASAQRDAVFVERWASGRSGTGLAARLATGRNCLQVQITPTELLITPHFPVTLGFVPEIYDLDKRVPLQDIRTAILLGGTSAQAVELTYTRADGAQGTLQLLLRRGAEFVPKVLLQTQR